MFIYGPETLPELSRNSNPRHKSWNTCVIFPSPTLIWVCSHFSAPKYARLNIGDLSENKGVKRECKKFGENSRQMAPVSTTCDEYWGLRRKWWSCKWCLDENESDSGCNFTYIVIVFKIITERDYQACRFWICQDWQRRSGYTTIHSLLRVTSGKNKITQNDLVLFQF